MTITVNTESKPVKVETKEKAEKMICTTAYALQWTKDELKKIKELQRLADHFGIDTDEIIITPTMNDEERNQGYANKYSFK